MGQGYQTNIVNATSIEIDVNIQYQGNDPCFGQPGAETFTLGSTDQSGLYYSEVDGCFNAQAALTFGPSSAPGNLGSAMIMYDNFSPTALPSFVYLFNVSPCNVSTAQQAAVSLYPIISLSVTGEWTLATITFYLAENVVPTPAPPS